MNLFKEMLESKFLCFTIENLTNAILPKQKRYNSSEKRLKVKTAQSTCNEHNLRFTNESDFS